MVSLPILWLIYIPVLWFTFVKSPGAGSDLWWITFSDLYIYTHTSRIHVATLFSILYSVSAHILSISSLYLEVTCQIYASFSLHLCTDEHLSQYPIINNARLQVFSTGVYRRKKKNKKKIGENNKYHRAVVFIQIPGFQPHSQIV